MKVFYTTEYKIVSLDQTDPVKVPKMLKEVGADGWILAHIAGGYHWFFYRCLAKLEPEQPLADCEPQPPTCH